MLLELHVAGPGVIDDVTLDPPHPHAGDEEV
jgi:hypothetical protein